MVNYRGEETEKTSLADARMQQHPVARALGRQEARNHATLSVGQREIDPRPTPLFDQALERGLCDAANLLHRLTAMNDRVGSRQPRGDTAQSPAKPPAVPHYEHRFAQLLELLGDMRHEIDSLVARTMNLSSA